MGKKIVCLSWRDISSAAEQVANLIEARTEDFHWIYGVPRGGIFAAQAVHQKLSFLRGSCSLVDDPKDATIFIDDILDSGKTRDLYEKYNRPFYTLFQKTNSSEWFSFPWERMSSEQGAEDNVVRLIQFIGDDPEREGLRDTPRRVVDSWKTLYGGYNQDPKSIMTVFDADGYNQMIVLRDIEFYSTCEHHILPFFGKAHIGYIPDKKILGASKLARLLEIFARRLQIQERIGDQVVDTLQDCLHPQGVGCVLEAQHLCMTSRGVQKQNSIFTTASMRGSFLEPDVKQEFLAAVRRGI